MGPVLTILIPIVFAAISGARANSAARRLAYDDLVKDIQGRQIDPLIPPFPDEGPVPIQLNFGLHRVVDLDSDSAILTVSGMIRVGWTDSRFTWTNRSQPDFILLPAKSVWMPEFTLLTSPTFSLSKRDRMVMVKRSGAIVIEKTIQERVACQVNVRRFPRDVQHCALVFVPSISYRGVVSPRLHKISGGDPISDVGEEWSLLAYVQTESNVSVSHSDGEVGKSSAFVARMLLSRNHAFYFLTIIIPTLMLAMMTLVPYAIPPSQCGPKLIIPVTTFLSFNIYMLLLEKTLPKAAKLPVLGQSYAAMLFVGLITEVSQAIAVKFYSCHIKHIPRPLEFIYFRVLAPIFCFNACHGFDFLLRHEEELNVSPADRRKRTLKTWLSMGRITDRVGLVVSILIITVALLYLFINILTPDAVPTAFRSVLS